MFRAASYCCVRGSEVLAKLRSTNLRSDLLLAQMFDDLVAFFTFHTPYTVLRTLTKIVIYIEKNHCERVSRFEGFSWTLIYFDFFAQIA